MIIDNIWLAVPSFGHNNPQATLQAWGEIAGKLPWCIDGRDGGGQKGGVGGDMGGRGNRRGWWEGCGGMGWGWRGI